MVQIRKLKIVGTGHGLEFDATFGEIKIELDGKTTRVFIPGDEKGVVVDRSFPTQFPELNIQARLEKGGELKWNDDLGKAQAAFQSLRDAFVRSYRGLIRVNSGGDVKGSNLAGKVKIKLVDGSFITRTVPGSQVESIDGHLWIPRWLVIEKADGKAFTGETRLPFVLESAIDQMDAELTRQVKLLKELALPFQEAERLEAPKRAERERLAKEAAIIESKRKSQEFAKQLEKQKAASLKAEARIAALPIHVQNVTLRGKDYERSRGQIISKDWELHNATVRVSGKRGYVFKDEFALKPLFWKPLLTLEIVSS